ncbi:MAG: hypothetical protein FJY26_06705 [Betaproteobacteria bacterium]|nr:hypothetical protein [Betaproteobacteria bacterium]
MYQGTAAKASGGCALFADGQLAGSGWCSACAAKPG